MKKKNDIKGVSYNYKCKTLSLLCKSTLEIVKALGIRSFNAFKVKNIDKVSMKVALEFGMVIKFRCSSNQEANLLIKDLQMIEGVLSIRAKRSYAI